MRRGLVRNKAQLGGSLVCDGILVGRLWTRAEPRRVSDQILCCPNQRCIQVLGSGATTYWFTLFYKKLEQCTF